ncbi:MAG: non-hydrolyzing UDP-N-acetylglucosamine 2-epimerase [Candidatus Bipolaricaulia bacterium]
MRELKALAILGTRPEAVKLASVIGSLHASDAFDARVGITGQHRELIRPFLGVFGIEPDWDLALMAPDQTLTDLTSVALSKLRETLDQERPDVVVVQGDTTTAFAATLAAFYQRIPIAHVEAGLRSGNRDNPFPEEAHRRLVDAISDYLFAPTDDARANLIAEGHPASRIWVTGNTAIDAMLDAVDDPRLDEVKLPIEWDGDRRLVVVTAHRRESFGADLANICHALRRLATERDDVEIVYPVHVNPHVRVPVCERIGHEDRIHLIDPLPYLEFVKLLRCAHVVLTDSGGIQEEAPALDVPVLVMRRATERPEVVESGAGRLVGTDIDGIVSATSRVLDDAEERDRMARAPNPFGDGHAGARIVRALEAAFGAPE